MVVTGDGDGIGTAIWRAEMWRNGNVVSFRCLSIESGKVVLNNGRAEIVG